MGSEPVFAAIEVRGRRPTRPMIASGALVRRGALLGRRIRWVGRGWPASALLGRSCRVTGQGLVALGDDVRINHDVWLNCESGASLSIGPCTSVGRGSVLSSLRSVDIAEDVLLGPYVLVMDHVHGSAGGGPIIHQQFVPRGRIVIEAGAWLGAYSGSPRPQRRCHRAAEHCRRRCRSY